MKILFCANIYEGGFVGPARLAEGLLKINDIYKGEHELRILTADVKTKQLPVYKMQVRYPRFLRFFDFWFRGWAFYKGILRVKKEFDFDVVLFGNANSALVSKLFCRKLKIGGFVNDYNMAAVNWFDFYKHEGGKSLVLLKHVEMISVRSLDFLFVCSHYLKRVILEKYRVNDSNIHVLYQGIDIEKMQFKVANISRDTLIHILFVKYRFRLGGLQDLAKALSMLNEFSFKLTVIGPPKKHFEEIGKWFEGISHVKLVLKGTAPQTDVHVALKEHDILCIPSHMEAQGLAKVEGLAHGISVVSTREGGIPEVLDYGKNGWLCEKRSPSSLANAIRECINTNSEERFEILKRGRFFAEQNFDIYIMMEKMLIILSKQMQQYKSES